MNANVDLRQLAIDRGGNNGLRLQRRRHWLTRYVLPGLLISGFLLLVVWAAWDFLFPPQPVTVVQVLATMSQAQREGTPLFNAAGWIEPRPTPVRVAALAAGVVEELLVVEDQEVKRGDPIAQLVKRDAQLTLDAAAASLALAEADLHEVQASLTAATTRMKQPVHLQAALAEAATAVATLDTEIKNLPFEARRSRARLDLAQRNYDRKTSLQDAVAGREIDEAKSELDAAQALVDELELRASSLAVQRSAVADRQAALATQLELLTDEIKARDEAKAKVDAATARVQLAHVALDEAHLRLERMTIRAPVDGRVYQLLGQPGTTMSGSMAKTDSADTSTVVTMYRPEMLQVRADVRFEDIPKVNLGQLVQIENPALTSPLIGKVLFVGSEANIQKNTLEVKVAIAGSVAVFKPEMLVNVTFLAPEQPETTSDTTKLLRIFVPQEFVRQDERGRFVWIADQQTWRAPRNG